MKFVITALLAATTAAKTASSSDMYAFEQYKVDYNRNYSESENAERLEIFVKNLAIIEERNNAERQAGGSAVHGINQFTDMHPEEFKSMFLSSDVSMKTSEDRVYAEDLPDFDTSTEVDWTGVYTTPVKNQRQCGSCWAFSATEQIESDLMRLTGSTVILSPQNIVSCDKTSQGCNGGWTESAYTYVKNNGGLETESDYPYTSWIGNSGTCKADSSKAAATISGYTTVSGEDNMASYVQSTGPLSVCLDASTWSSYTGGVLKVCGSSVDHCVQAVGVLPDSDTGYWKVRNSWGTTWGESGFIRLSFGGNTCDITNDPTYTDATLV
ncbi:hypothetical protein TL16_g00947 [Triparma laevis f. inornata]|uniref:Uncharacterized protein n=2 Tax=Triparma laevis TaxID=1534972 RepID=A0A9W7CHP0_9STRA|nr:hypothetical protein TL16_g00947 [Triparma laevis f. inornata]GMI08412.1 hypothetical protein TrLO_g4643 [Triparma laevis f. longispina]